MAGWEVSEPAPKYDYETAVRLAGIPIASVGWGGDLTGVRVLRNDDYDKSYASLADWTDNENLHARYG